MGFTALLDVALGLGLIYLGASLLVTVLNEWVAHLLQLRGRALGSALTQLLDLDELATVRTSPLLRPLVNSAKRLRSSYVDTRSLAHSIIGAVSAVAMSPAQRESGEPVSIEQLRAQILKLPDSSIRGVLVTISQSVGRVDQLVGELADWSERSLTALGESYKKRIQWIGLGMGLLVAVAGNVQTLDIVKRLYSDKELRDYVSVASEQSMRIATPDLVSECSRIIAHGDSVLPPVSGEPAPGIRAATPSSAPGESGRCAPVIRLVDGMLARDRTLAQLPVGWGASAESFATAIKRPENWIGWLLTALALSLGAPFWFDMLNRVVTVRHSMRKPELGPTGESGRARS